MARKRRKPTIEAREHRCADGSITEMWSVRYYDATGARRRIRCASLEEADFERARMVLAETRGELLATSAEQVAAEESDLTLAQFWPMYRADAAGRLAPSTLREYERLWDRRLQPRFAQLPLAAIRPRLVSEWRASCSRLASAPRPCGTRWSCCRRCSRSQSNGARRRSTRSAWSANLARAANARSSPLRPTTSSGCGQSCSTTATSVRPLSSTSSTTPVCAQAKRSDSNGAISATGRSSSSRRSAMASSSARRTTASIAPSTCSHRWPRISPPSGLAQLVDPRGKPADRRTAVDGRPVKVELADPAAAQQRLRDPLRLRSLRSAGRVGEPLASHPARPLVRSASRKMKAGRRVCATRGGAGGGPSSGSLLLDALALTRPRRAPRCSHRRADERRCVGRSFGVAGGACLRCRQPGVSA